MEGHLHNRVEVLRARAASSSCKGLIILNGLDQSAENIVLQTVEEAHLGVIHLDVIADVCLLTRGGGSIPSGRGKRWQVDSQPVVLVDWVSKSEGRQELELIVELLEYLKFCLDKHIYLIVVLELLLTELNALFKVQDTILMHFAGETHASHSDQGLHLLWNKLVQVHKLIEQLYGY